MIIYLCNSYIYVHREGGIEKFKGVFVNLLIETSADFSLRSVPQLTVVGPLNGSRDICGESNIDDLMNLSEKDLLSQLPPQPAALKRSKSAEMRDAELEANALNPPVWARQTSEEVAKRFSSMISWEDSDHPIALFTVYISFNIY